MLTIKSFFMRNDGRKTPILSMMRRKNAVLIDCGALHAEEHQAIADYISSHGLHLSQAWLTHGHFRPYLRLPMGV